jgi:hypothetical protein
MKTLVGIQGTTENAKMVFKPRKSIGQFSAAGIGLLLLIIGVAYLMSMLSLTTPSLPIFIAPVILGGLGIFFVILAMCYPTLRYEIEGNQLTLIYAPFIRYQIELSQIKRIRSMNLEMSIISSIRLPGLALFNVNYPEVGNVHMCASAALKNILLIETEAGKYGITPENEEAFAAELRSRMDV